MSDQQEQLTQVWRQNRIPVVFRQGLGHPLLVKLPRDLHNREWLRNGQRNKPEWDSQHKCWKVPRAWFEKVVRRVLQKFDELYLIQPLLKHQKCAPACWDAEGITCECSCMGENHGSGKPGGRWYIVSDTCAVQWGEREYAYSVIRNRT